MKNEEVAFLKNGGSAFPVDMGMKIWPGMSLRDWFAGMALIGLIAMPENQSLWYGKYEKDAYLIADAMLVERKKEKSQ